MSVTVTTLVSRINAYVMKFVAAITIGFSLDLDTWTISSIMFENKLLHACAVNSVPEMVINGGYSSDSTWTTDDGETFGILPPMPFGLHDHCLVALDGDDLFVAGFHNYNPKTFLYHSDTMEWEQIQDMPDPTYAPPCAMVHNSAGEQEVIVVDCEYTQIYNLQSGEWRFGKLNDISLLPSA